jgi:hypothetical protein
VETVVAPTRSNAFKLIKGRSTLLSRVAELKEHCVRLYLPIDLPRLFLKVLKQLSTPGMDLRMKLRESTDFEPILSTIHVERDATSAKFLREHVYNDEAFALLRLCVNLSKRECALLQQSFKWRRDENGNKRRLKMAADSLVSAPELFSVAGIERVEKAAEIRSGVQLVGDADGRGASVDGQFGVDQVIYNQIAATRHDRTGGMATSGDANDPHIINVTGDGAGISAARTGVRVSIFAGSTEMLNQSSHDVADLVMYQVRSNPLPHPLV